MPTNAASPGEDGGALSTTTPSEVFRHHTAECLGGSGGQLEIHREHDVGPIVQDAVIVAELEVFPIHRLSFSLFREDFGGFDHLFQENGAGSLRRG